MSDDINLLLDRKRQSSSKTGRVARLRVAAGISLSVVVLSAIILLILNKLSGIDVLLQQEQRDTAKISSQQKIVGKLLLLQSRLTDINSIFMTRSSPDVFIQQITAGMPSNVHIDSFGLTSKKISLAVTSSSLTDLDQFTNYLLTKVNNKQLFKTLTISGVIADPSNQKYILSIDTDLL